MCGRFARRACRSDPSTGPFAHEGLEKHMSTMLDLNEPDALLTPGEVASLFRVTPKTVTRWAEAGKLDAVRTLGGHRRFPVREVLRVKAEVERPGRKGSRRAK